ncbi:MAG: ABC transporter ATP-binding protein [Acidimicrobiales bacterium]
MSEGPRPAQRSPGRVLVGLMADQRRVLTQGIAGGLVWQAAGIGVPVLLGWIIDSGIRAEDSRVVWWGATAIVAIAVVEAVGTAIRHRSACTADERGKVALRDALVAAVVADDRGPTAELSPGELLGRSTGDVDELGGFLDSVSHTVSYALSVPAVVVILAFVDWPLAVVIALMIPALVAIMWRYSVVWQERSIAVREAFDAATGAGEELIEGFRVTAGLGIGQEMADRYTSRSAVLRDASIRRGRLWLAFEPFVEGLSMVAVTVVMWLGGLRVIDGHLEVGQLVTAMGLALFLTWPVRTLGERIVTIQTALASAARLIDLLDHPVDDADDAAAPAPAGVTFPLGVSLRDLMVERAGSIVLRVPDLDLPAQAMVQISGPTGSGKSTLLDVVAGELDATVGSVHLGGVAVSDWAPTARRRAVLVAGPAPFLFAGTIADNVRFGAPDASDAEVRAALAVADALEFVDALPEGIETVLGERGITLSGGQRQRIGLARALAAEPAVLALDGAVSAVDPDRERAILDAIRRRRADRLTLVVSTNPTIDDLIDDHVVVAADGRVVATRS